MAIPPSTVRIRERMIAALEAPTTTADQISTIIGHLRETLKQCRESSAKSFLLFLAVATLYTLLVKNQATSFKVADIELARTSFAVVWIPAVAAFAFYRSVMLEIFAYLLEKVLLQYYRKTMPAFHKNDIFMLATFPSALDGDNTLQNLFPPLRNFRWFGTAWTIVSSLVIIGLPLAWFVMSAYWTLTLNQVGMLSKASSVAVTFLFLFRSVWILIQAWKYGV